MYFGNGCCGQFVASFVYFERSKYYLSDNDQLAPVSTNLPSILYGRACWGGEGRGVRKGVCRGIDSSIFSPYQSRAEADACRLQHGDPGGALLLPRRFARRRSQRPEPDLYCTSLHRYPTALSRSMANTTASNWAAAKEHEAAATGGFNGRCTSDKYSRRPRFCGTKVGKNNPRKHLFPQQTPKLKAPNPKGFPTFCFETRLQNLRDDDQDDQYLSRCQNHECCPLQPLTGNWTCEGRNGTVKGIGYFSIWARVGTQSTQLA